MVKPDTEGTSDEATLNGYADLGTTGLHDRVVSKLIGYRSCMCRCKVVQNNYACLI